MCLCSSLEHGIAHDERSLDLVFPLHLPLAWFPSSVHGADESLRQPPPLFSILSRSLWQETGRTRLQFGAFHSQ